jgi:4-hydroxy-tetrahydrodipicolinate synthase
MNRRRFLACSPALVLSAAGQTKADGKPLRGIFPIAQSPFSDDDRLDVDTLVAELGFLHRGGIHGCVWPQLASEWWTLSREERLSGAEALCAAGRKLKPAIVIGVQADSPAAATAFASHAAQHGADALIALPPPREKDPRIIREYYQTIGKATDLPLIVQAIGNLSVDEVIEIAAAVPTIGAVKDEAGEPLARIAAFRQKTGGRLQIFTGNHGRTMIDELLRGFAGTMPAAAFSDLYAAAWDLWHGGKRREAADMFARAALLIQEVSAYGTESMKYLLCLRGVFKTYRTRESQQGVRARLDDEAKKNLREILDLLKPHLRA